MGIENIGLSFSGASSEESLQRVCIRPATGTPTVYLKWTTVSGLDWNGTFDVAVEVRGVPRGLTGTGDSGYGEMKPFYTRLEASACGPVALSGRDGYQWAAPIDLDGNGIEGSLLDHFGPLEYMSRKFDSLKIMVAMKSNYVDGKVDGWGRTHSSREELNDALYVDWVPTFVLQRGYFDTAKLVLEYACTGWDRPDDRWALEALEQNLTSSLYRDNLLAKDFSYGSVAKTGLIEVPMSDLNRMPDGSKYVFARVRMNTVYHVSGYDFATFSNYVPIEDRSKCSAPRIKAAWEGTALRVSVTDSKDRTPSFTSCLVKLRGGRWSFDQGTCAAGDSVLFPNPPLGTDVTVDAVGFADNASSSTATVTVAGKACGHDIIGSVDGESMVELLYNVEHERSSTPNVTLQRIHGRERQVMWRGEGADAEWSVSCSIAERDGMKLERQTQEQFEALETAGVCVLRTADGLRRAVAVTSVKVGYGTPSFTKTVTLVLAEVDCD